MCIRDRHLNCARARKKVAGPQALEQALRVAEDRGDVDIICGDLNMARWKTLEKGVGWEDHEDNVGHIVCSSDSVYDCLFFR